LSLPVLNLETARFECTFGRGCDGVCCRNGRPPVYPEEAERIDDTLDRILTMLRPRARSLVEKAGCLGNRRKAGQRTARVADGWCVFFNAGCVLHRLGESEGAPFRYKPALCSVFPLAKDGRDQWYVRQRAYKGEIWDLFCLDPSVSAIPAAESLREEIALAEAWGKGLAGALIPSGEALPPGQSGRRSFRRGT
jgi:hypothetical protein